MKRFIQLTKWFHNESLSYMKGYSKWYVYTRMPLKYFKFMYLTFNTKEK
jgi:hypothetical protein